jgi:tryptophan halogenase
MALQADRNINRITIVGGGTSGYLTAFHLSKKYPSKSITWIFPEDNKPIGVGEALIPDVSHFLNNLGISHEDVIKHCNGTLKLGIVFDGFNEPGDKFSFPFGVTNTPIHNAASVERIMDSRKVPNNILEYGDISVHFRSTELLAYMDTLVSAIPNLTVDRRSVTKEELAGTYDLLIDSTGFGRYISNIPNNFKSIQDVIPNNRALLYRHEYTDVENQLVPYSIFKAMDHGWIWNIPLGNELAIGYVHCDKFDVRQEFAEYVKEKFGETVNPESFGSVAMVTGRNEVHIKDNIVAIGLASAFIEPIESTGLYFVTSALEKLGKYIDGEMTEIEYNTQVNDEFDSVTNFILAHYKYSKRSNEYWDMYKNAPVTNHQTIEIFPSAAWDYILAGFDQDSRRPMYPVNVKELIDIQRGNAYHKWIQDEKNAT